MKYLYILSADFRTLKLTKKVCCSSNTPELMFIDDETLVVQSSLGFFFGGIMRQEISVRDCQKGKGEGEGDAVDDDDAVGDDEANSEARGQ